MVAEIFRFENTLIICFFFSFKYLTTFNGLVKSTGSGRCYLCKVNTGSCSDLDALL